MFWWETYNKHGLNVNDLPVRPVILHLYVSCWGYHFIVDWITAWIDIENNKTKVWTFAIENFHLGEFFIWRQFVFHFLYIQLHSWCGYADVHTSDVNFISRIKNLHLQVFDPKEIFVHWMPWVHMKKKGSIWNIVEDPHLHLRSISDKTVSWFFSMCLWIS